MASRDNQDDFFEGLAGAMVSNGMGGHSAPNPFAQAAIRATNPGGGGGGGGVGGGTAVGKAKGGGLSKSGAAPQSNPIIDALLGLLGSGGGGGSYVAGYNGAAARAAAQQAYNTQLGNARNVYGQIIGEVTDRAPAIAAGYQQATDQINADAAARAQSDAAIAADADQRNADTAAALGLHVMPTNDQADALQQAGKNAYQSNAQAWTGFNDASSQLAQERNTAVADTFRYGQTQAEQYLASVLQSALDAISGREAANPGRYVGGGGGASFSDQFRVLNTLLNYDMDQQQLAASMAGKQSPLATISPAGWGAIQQAYGGGVTSGSQGNAAALAGLANNPRDFAILYSTLYG